MITIRQATVDDADAIWELLEPVFRAGDTYAVDPLISRDAALEYWCDQPARTYVALQGDRVVGTYYIKTNQPGGGAHICNCGYIVAAAARGQGLARSMCLHSQQMAVTLGYRSMQFNFVLSSNTGAVRLWQDLGFVIVGTIPQAFAHPDGRYVDAHVMHQALAGN